MNWFIVAGEASGDLHAANLAKEIPLVDANANLKGWGGPKMRQAHVEITKDYDELALMGFVEVITKIPQVLRNLKFATQEIIDNTTDAVVLVDFSGFNLRLAKRLRNAGYSGKIFYYISPKMWVWNQKRVEQVKSYIDAMFCILPFEVDFYNNHGYNQAYYIGNPIMDEISDFEPDPNFLETFQIQDKPYIALLPGSRKNEINQILPEMLKSIPDFPDKQFVLAASPNVRFLIDQVIEKGNKPEVKIIENQTYNILHYAEAALVTSGTATLETALLGTPEVLCYKGNAISYAIAKRVVSIDYIGLPNLILGREMVKELIQSDLTPPKISAELSKLCFNPEYQFNYQKNVIDLQKKVGPAGASQRAAEKMYSLLKEPN